MFRCPTAQRMAQEYGSSTHTLVVEREAYRPSCRPIPCLRLEVCSERGSSRWSGVYAIFRRRPDWNRYMFSWIYPVRWRAQKVNFPGN